MLINPGKIALEHVTVYNNVIPVKPRIYSYIPVLLKFVLQLHDLVA